MKFVNLCGAIVWSAFLLTTTPIFGQDTLTIDAGLRGPAISDTHYGIFFEEINHAGDGGLYAELIRNRSFEDNSNAPDSWSAIGAAQLTMLSSDLLNTAQNRALSITSTKSGDGVSNTGFWGINIVSGESYQLSFYAKSTSSYNGKLSACLQNTAGKTIGNVDINVTLTNKWQKFTATLTATESASDGHFALLTSTSGNVCLDVVSLFPPTFKNRPNGLRIDLAQKLADMHPAFVRFPGGCYVEGQYQNNVINRFEWKKTIGPIEERPGHLNANWGYRVSDGLGFLEFLELCEDIGAKPLFVVNVGIGHGWLQDYNNIGDYIQEALDAIEYANGDEHTTYGAKRIADGHKDPFNLTLMEIGNENYNNTNGAEQSDHYAERYEQMRKAIMAKYPYMTLIGNVKAWGSDNPSWWNAYPVQVVDEHYYRNPSWFVQQYNKYDSYSRSNYKVYTGEYAVTSSYGNYGNLNAALGEAVFMLGMENNSDVCIMNSYAPIFVNENNQGWRPDMIRFTASTSYGTPSYYVQKMFPNNVGKENVISKLGIGPSSSTDDVQIGLSTWGTAATYDDVKVTDGNGNLLINDDFSTDNTLWQTKNGSWSISNGQYNETATNVDGATTVHSKKIAPSHYIYEVKATKTAGNEGFLIVFNYQDENNYCWWNLGGWGNTKHAIEQCVGGGKTTIASANGNIVTGQTYNIKIEVDTTNVKCWLDGQLIHNATMSVSNERVYTSANINDETGIMYVKIVNPYNKKRLVHFRVNNATVNGYNYTVMNSESGSDENTDSNPYFITPQEHEAQALNSDATNWNNMTFEALPYSVNCLRLNVSDIHQVVSPEPTIPSPVLSYTFEKQKASDDSDTYNGTLAGGAQIVTMEDGNHALYTGSIDANGYMDMGNEVGKTILGGLTGDYSISLDLMVGDINKLANYCWAFSMDNGTNNYIGLVNAGGNNNWYYEIKKSGTTSVNSNSGLSANCWHNITFVQQASLGTIYVDGHAMKTTASSILPASIASNITSSFFARSPYSSDAIMENTYFDNFHIYNVALTQDQISAISRNTTKMANDLNDNTNVGFTTIDISRKSNIYDITGKRVPQTVLSSSSAQAHGIFIIDGKKVIK